MYFPTSLCWIRSCLRLGTDRLHGWSSAGNRSWQRRRVVSKMRPLRTSAASTKCIYSSSALKLLGRLPPDENKNYDFIKDVYCIRHGRRHVLVANAFLCYDFLSLLSTSLDKGTAGSVVSLLSKCIGFCATIVGHLSLHIRSVSEELFHYLWG